MRIIHEFYGRPQTTGTGSPYVFNVTEPPPKFKGFRCELMAADCSGEGKNFKEGDALYLEGDGKSIKTMLKELIFHVEFIEEQARKTHDETVAKTKRCTNCRFWFAGPHDCEYFKKNLKPKKKRKRLHGVDAVLAKMKRQQKQQ